MNEQEQKILTPSDLQDISKIVSSNVKDIVTEIVTSAVDGLAEAVAKGFEETDRHYREHKEDMRNLSERVVSLEIKMDSLDSARIKSRIDSIEHTVFNKHGVYFDGFKKTLQPA